MQAKSTLEYLGLVAELGNKMGIQPINAEEASKMSSIGELYTQLTLLAVKELSLACDSWRETASRYGRGVAGPFEFQPKHMWAPVYDFFFGFKVKVINNLTFEQHANGAIYKIQPYMDSFIHIEARIPDGELLLYLIVDFAHTTVQVICATQLLRNNPGLLSYLWELDREIFGSEVMRNLIRRKTMGNLPFDYYEIVANAIPWGDFERIRFESLMPTEEIDWQ